MKTLVLFCMRILPKSLISRITGFLVRRQVSRHLIPSFCKKYDIDMDQVSIPDEGFQTFQHFFVRSLLPQARPVCKEKNGVIAPVDGRVTQFGPITGTRIMQAKELDFLVPNLVPDDVHHLFIDGYFATFYLSPADYHRVHAPVSGTIQSLIYQPGTLFPVQELYTNSIRRLFTKNERLITIIETEVGKCAVCMIGAMNVGHMAANYYDYLRERGRSKKFTKVFEGDRPLIHTGDELGRFMLGSTVIILFEKDMFEPSSLRASQQVRMGEKIGIIQSSL